MAHNLRPLGVNLSSSRVRGSGNVMTLRRASNVCCASRQARSRTRRAQRGAGLAAGAAQLGVPRPPREIVSPRRTNQPRHVLLGHAEGNSEGICASGRTCQRLCRHRQGLHLENADHGLRPVLQAFAAVLRRARHRGAGRQRPRVLQATQRKS
jgi:hypothetical protein